MPLIPSPYQAKSLFKNGHFSTIYSAKIRPIPSLLQKRERINLADGDFLDVDWSFSKTSTKRVAILLHGLEGNAQRTYMRGAGAFLKQNGWDVAAMNYRGCSGEPNVLYESYNAGRTDDLEAVVQYILKKDKYEEICLVGFSLGGNLLLKYLGERDTLPKQIKKGMAISSPLDLLKSLEALMKPENWVYRTSFLQDLRKKYRQKMSQFPDKVTLEASRNIKTLLDFDNIYTAPAHGYIDAHDYYQQNSCLQFLPNIRIPVLILNAVNDSFLSPCCYPRKLAKNSKYIYLESPEHGGHVGFHVKNDLYYNEQRTLDFIND